MSLYHSENTPGDISVIESNEHYNGPQAIEMGSHEEEKNETEYHLASETMEVSPRSTHSGTSSSEIFASPIGKIICAHPRQKSGRTPNIGSSIVRPIPSSSIPLPVKSSGPIKVPPLLKNARSVNRAGSMIGRPIGFTNKHTLEIQFINKNKRFSQMRRELLEKQKPIMDLYHNLVQIKKRLEEHGKNVKLDEVKLVYFEDYNKRLTPDMTGSGEQDSMEIINGMKSSIEEIPKTLMDICKNLLSRRGLIVDLLESVTKSEVDVNQVSDKIESLKTEGLQLQHSLDAVIKEHEFKIAELVTNWRKLLNDKQYCHMDTKIDELEAILKNEEKFREESSVIIHDLQKKLEEKKNSHEKSLTELNVVLQSLRDHVKKLEQDLEVERRTSLDFKTRNSTNSQTLKSMRLKINELESDKKEIENSNSELHKKIRLMQDQMKHKENQWTKEKDEMNKSLKHQENLLQKLTADKNQFETRLETIKNTKNDTEKDLQTTIYSLNNELQYARNQLNILKSKRDEALTKCSQFENYIVRRGAEFKETMYKVSCSVEWGKAEREFESPAVEEYMQEMAKDLRIRELEDKICELEKEHQVKLVRSQEKNEITPPIKIQLELRAQNDSVESYELLLEESENKLKRKLHGLRSMEIEKLRAEIRQLKMRQDSLEEQNETCDSQELQQMLNDGRNKLKELLKKSNRNEGQLEEYKSIIRKQIAQMNEMDNLLRYRGNMANVLKSSRNDLLLEKESLARYCREARVALAEVTSQSRLQDSFISSLKEKLVFRENKITNLKKEITELEGNLRSTNQKRYRLQETVGSLEQDVQKYRAKQIKQTNSVKGSGGSWRLLGSVCDVNDDKKPNRQVSDFCNSLMELEESQLNMNIRSYKESIPRKPTLHSNIYRKTMRELSKTKRNTLCRSSEYPCPLQSSEVSDNNVTFESNSFQFSDKTSSLHTNYHHRANSRSLISVSLQTVDFIKRKLNLLTSVNTPLSENSLLDDIDIYPIINTTQISSTQPSNLQNAPHGNLDKILELTAHRYEYLHNQAEDSYGDLTRLVRVAVTQKDSIFK